MTATHPYHYSDADGNEKTIECDGTWISDCRICHPRRWINADIIEAHAGTFTGHPDSDAPRPWMRPQPSFDVMVTAGHPIFDR